MNKLNNKKINKIFITSKCVKYYEYVSKLT